MCNPILGSLRMSPPSPPTCVIGLPFVLSLRRPRPGAFRLAAALALSAGAPLAAQPAPVPASPPTAQAPPDSAVAASPNVGPHPPSTDGLGTRWKPFRRSFYTPDMKFEARLRLDSTGVVTLRTPEDSVSLVRGTFNLLIQEYVRADSSRVTTNIGVTDGQAYLELRAWVAGLVAAVFALGIGVVGLIRRSRRQRREAARVVEQRRMAEAAREAERERLARDLHDGVLQMLYAIRFHLPETTLDLAPGLQTVDGLLVQTADQVRSVTAQLRAPMDATVRLPDALRSLYGHYPNLDGTVDVAPEALDGLAPEAALAVFRLAQEGLSNAVRHGRATRVDIALAGLDGGARRLTLTDDGQGFDPSAAPGPDSGGPESSARSHFGLVGMRERVEALGGTLALTSAPGAGTRVEATLPA